jgi:hypothetical protein
VEERCAEAAVSIFRKHTWAADQMACRILARIQSGCRNDSHPMRNHEAGNGTMQKAAGQLRFNESPHLLERVAPRRIQTEGREDHVTDCLFFVARSGTDGVVRGQVRLVVRFQPGQIPRESLPTDELHECRKRSGGSLGKSTPVCGNLHEEASVREKPQDFVGSRNFAEVLSALEPGLVEPPFSENSRFLAPKSQQWSSYEVAVGNAEL